MFLISHRGNDNHGFSENSLNAILEVLDKDYIDGVEIDIRITKDKKLILIHDPVIDFISDGSGVVSYLTLSELEKYKYGKSKETISTLEEVLSKIKNNKIILLELKEMGNNYIELVDETIKIINRYSYLNIFVSSFNFLLLTYLKNNYSNVKCGLIVGYGLNTSKLNNNFDFNITSGKYISKYKKKEYNFIFGLTNEEIEKISLDIYLITDKPYSIVKSKKWC